MAGSRLDFPRTRIETTRFVNVPNDWNAQLSESMQIRVTLSDAVDVSKVTSLSVRSNSGSNQLITNTLANPYSFTGTYSFNTPNMKDGSADIDVYINDSKVVGSSHFTIARFKWFQRGEPIVYAKTEYSGGGENRSPLQERS